MEADQAVSENDQEEMIFIPRLSSGHRGFSSPFDQQKIKNHKKNP
jgi:hypothetical protein